MEFDLPFPPSVNGYWRSFRGRQIISKAGREYRESILALVRPQEPLQGELEVSLYLFPPDKRRRDIDNYIKALLDALTHAGVWNDDSQVKRLSVDMMPPGQGKCWICIKQRPPKSE